MEEKDVVLKEKNLEEQSSEKEKVMPERIPLDVLIEKAKDFISGKISQEEMAVFGGEIIIRSYLPILDKMGVIMSIIGQHMYSTVETQEIKTVELYRNIFFYLILGGYAGIDCSNRELITYSNYDLLYPIYAPFVLSYCKDDYDLTMEMLKESINLYNIQNMAEGLEGINENALREATKANKELMRELGQNKELIHELKEIASFNDPMTHRVVDEVRKIALENTKKNTDEVV